jgi:hypothetical protein
MKTEKDIDWKSRALKSEKQLEEVLDMLGEAKGALFQELSKNESAIKALTDKSVFTIPLNGIDIYNKASDLTCRLANERNLRNKAIDTKREIDRLKSELKKLDSP